MRISDPTAVMRSASLTATACLRPQGVALSSAGSKSTKSGSELRERLRAASTLAEEAPRLGTEKIGWFLRRSSQSCSVPMVRGSATERESGEESGHWAADSVQERDRDRERGQLTPRRACLETVIHSHAHASVEGCASSACGIRTRLLLVLQFLSRPSPSSRAPNLFISHHDIYRNGI